MFLKTPENGDTATREREPLESARPFCARLLPRFLKASMLKHGPPTIGLNAPAWCAGMRHAFHCWSVEDNALSAAHYAHVGTTVWYGVPASRADDVEACWRSVFPQLWARHPDLKALKASLFSPEVLRLHGIPCYTCVQRPRSWVVSLPSAYRCGWPSSRRSRGS